MNHIPALLLCCVTLTGLLQAQDPDRTEKSGKGQHPEAGTTEEGFADEKAQQLAAGEGDMKGRPTVRTDLVRFCDFIGSARPSPIPPGATGTFNVIAILKGDGVISDATSVTLDYQRKQGPLILGEPIWPAAKPGKLAAGFLGRPVFEDTMVVSIPVTVAPGTAFGNHAVLANVTANLTQGSNGVVIGEIKAMVNAAVNVGPASVLLNVPDRAASPEKAAAGNQATTGKHGEPTAGEVGKPAPTAQPTGQALTPAEPAGQGHDDPTPTPEGPRAPEKEGPSLLLLVGGGFAVLLLAVLLLAKKK
jgi:hypothetical protein